MFDIKEFIFDGVTNTPDVLGQGMDMHSFYDGEFIWFPYSQYEVATATRNKLLKFDPITEVMEIIDLEPTGADNCVAYQAIQGNDFDTIWIYSTYITRALWKFSKTGQYPTEYIKLNYGGDFGGKITSVMLGEVEHIVGTIVTTGYPVAYNTSTEEQTELNTLPLGTYGIQTDGYNMFVVGKNAGGSFINAFTMDVDHVVSINATMVTIGSIDCAYDGTDIWASSATADTTMVERFEPTYTLQWVTGFERKATHYTNAPHKASPASIKANDRYVACCWESGNVDPPTVAWNVLDKNTGLWLDFFSQVDDVLHPDYLTVPYPLYPYSVQYWVTCTIEIDTPDIWIAGYSPALQGGVMNADSCPNKSARIIRLRPVNSLISDGAITGSTISSN